MTQLPLDQEIAALRRFTRFFAQQLAPLDAGPAGSPYSATEVRVLTELAQYDQGPSRQSVAVSAWTRVISVA